MTHHFTQRRARMAVAAASALTIAALAVPLAFAAGPQPGAPASGPLFSDTTNTASGDTIFNSANGSWRFTSNTAVAVQAQTYTGNVPAVTGDNNSSLHGAVRGQNSGNGPGVWGSSAGSGAGLSGLSTGVDGAGAVGYAEGYIGMYGQANGTATGGGGDGGYFFTKGDGGYGVVGDADGGVFGGVGVWGQAFQSDGVVGVTDGNSMNSQVPTAGILGFNYHVDGGDSAYNAGVTGLCADCTGVEGDTSNYIGVRGNSYGDVNSYGGVFSNTNGTGVLGMSDTHMGVWGYSNVYAAVLGSSPRSIGVYGYSGSEIGVYAETERYVALWARNKCNPCDVNDYAGVFEGNVGVTGQVYMSGTLSSFVHTNSGDRLLYANQSTKNIFSDQGTATLTNGHAVVNVDSLYAQAANLGAGYQVFLTPRSFSSKGLAVGNVTATSFEVREISGGSGSYSFDWRIDAPRRGFESARMALAPGVPQRPADVASMVPVVPNKAPALIGPRSHMPVTPPTRPNIARPTP